MKNILNQKPNHNLNGRLLYGANLVQDVDIKNKNILNIGCGYGWFELNVLNRGVNKIVGMEISENDLKTVKENIQNKRVEFKIGDAISLPFENNSFDTIVSWEVIEHISKNTEDLMFAEANRVLKKDGVFYLSTPHKSFLSNIFDPAWWLIGHRHYSKKQITEYANKNSFEVLDIQIKGKIWSLLASLNMYISKWIFRRKPIFQNYFIRKENFEYEKNNGFANIFVKFRKI